jgi:hypothetical protein
LTKLKHFTANECSITSAALLRLLEIDNELDMVRVWSCPGVDRDSHNQIQRLIKDENLDVYFEWYR